jgi:hypothetical protein
MKDSALIKGVYGQIKQGIKNAKDNKKKETAIIKD